MHAALTLIDAAFEALPLPLLQAWGRLAHAIGLVLAACAFGGLTFRSGDRWAPGRERQTWDERAVLSIPVTFIAILLTGYAGSFVVLVPGAQTFESLKDLVVFASIVLFGYPALLTVPFAYGLSDLIEGVPPGCVLEWLPGYFINPACFWIAYQLIGADPDFRAGRTWKRYLAFVAAFMLLEPPLWGHICAATFTAPISYRSVTPALVFTTAITWLLAPFAMLVALPLARRLRMFRGGQPSGERAGEVGRAARLPIRMVILSSFIALMLLMVGATAFVALGSAQDDAEKLAARLHREIAANIAQALEDHLAAPGATPASISSLLKSLEVSTHGVALIVDRAGALVASSAPAEDPVAVHAVAELVARRESPESLQRGAAFAFDHVTPKPVDRTTWTASATAFRAPKGWPADWVVLTLMPESYYLAGVKIGHSRAALVFALALLLSVAAGALLAARVTDRLREISQATEALAAGRDVQRIPGSRMEELDTLADSFNRMASLLKRSFEGLRISEERLQLAIRAGQLGIVDWDVQRDRVVWDAAMCRLYDASPDELGHTVAAWTERLLPADRAAASAAVEAALRGERPFALEFRVRHEDGTVRTLSAVADTIRGADGRPARMVGISWDITERKRRDRLLEEEARILGLVASAAPLGEVLDATVRAIESLAPDTIGSVLLLDADGVHLRDGAGPNLPPEYRRMIDGAAIGPKAGSCGTAMHRRELVIVTDVETDPLWEDYRALVKPYGLRACWSSPVIDAGGAVLGTFALYYREPREPRAEELALIQRASHLAGVAIENRRGAERLQALSQRLVAVQEDERRRIARELHDEIGQMLTGFKLKLEATSRGAPEAVSSALLEMVGDAKDLIARARDLALQLRPSMLDDLGLIPALEWHCESYRKQTGIAVALEHRGLERRLPGELEIACYRIAQEALTNVARHAGVTEATVRLSVEGDTLTLGIEDRGCGFEVHTRTGSAGLLGMSERVAALRGRFSVQSSPGAGTRVRAELPLRQPRSEEVAP